MIDSICSYLNLQHVGYGWATLILMIGISLATYLALNCPSILCWFKTGDEVFPPFLALPAILFALFVSALATDVWQKHQQAKDALIKETAAIRSLFLLSHELSFNGILLKDATVSYVNAVTSKEWGAMINSEPETKNSALPALEVLDSVIVKIGGDLKLSEYNAMRLNTSLETIRLSRLQRLALAHDPISVSKWSACLTLAVLTLVTMGFVHIRRPKAMIISMALTVLCVVATINSLSKNRSPYIGAAAVSIKPFSETFNVLNKPEFE
jgi:hypothetical protein